MQTVWAWLADELIGSELVLLSPVVLDLQLPQPLGPGESRLESIYSSSKVVLRLVEHFLVLQDLEDALFPVNLLLPEHEQGELVNGDVGLGAFFGEQLVALRTGRLKVLDPLWSWRHDQWLQMWYRRE